MSDERFYDMIGVITWASLFGIAFAAAWTCAWLYSLVGFPF